MRYMNFSWVIDGELGGSQGPAAYHDLFFLYSQGVRAVIRMEERTIPARGEGMADLVDMFEPVPDFTPPTMEQTRRMVAHSSTNRPPLANRWPLAATPASGAPARC